VGEYRRYAKRLNNLHRDKESKREEAFLAMKEQMEHEQRSRLSYLMGQETDPVARDIYREALEHGKNSRRSHEFQEYFSVAMEMDRSNYE
jgi:abortive infection bacteriophage resistance protein